MAKIMGILLAQSDLTYTPLPLKDESVHFVCTSPPYFNAKPEYATYGDYTSYLGFMLFSLAQCYRVLVNGGRLAINVPHGYDRPGAGGYKPIEVNMTKIIVSVGFELRGHIVWSKKGMSPQTNSTAWGSWQSASNPALRDEHEVIIVAHKGSAKREPVGKSTIDRETFLEATKSVWEIRPVTNSWHPAPFPQEIPRRLIELYTYENDIVLDPFVGSGTTVHVAAQLGRRGIGFDYKMDYLKQAYVPVAADRSDWEQVKKLLVKGDKGTDGLPMFGGNDGK